MLLYYFGNLARRPDRNQAMQTRLKVLGFPEENVHRCEAMDREHYPSPMALAEDAAQDGFPCFNLTPKDIENIRFFAINYWALNWTYMRNLREIANQEHNAILSHDDWGPSVKYSSYLKLLEEILNFDIGQVQWNIHSTEYKRPTSQYSEHWNRGIASTGQDLSIFTPRGAEWMLDICQKRFQDTAETLIFNYAYGADIDIFHFRDPDSIIKSVDGYQINNATVMSGNRMYQDNYDKNGRVA